ncbi:MAG: hypothetical protein MI892_07710 [Desulfobacterales bacterium]|nr:hypothetical protein [Desulfobacterales bacterium]
MKTKTARISKKVFFIPLGLIAMFILVAFGVIDLYFEQRALDRYEKDLTRLARSGAQMIYLMENRSDIPDFDRLADKFSENGPL